MKMKLKNILNQLKGAILVIYFGRKIAADMAYNLDLAEGKRKRAFFQSPYRYIKHNGELIKFREKEKC